jgi:hypothetical protein
VSLSVVVRGYVLCKARVSTAVGTRKLVVADGITALCRSTLCRCGPTPAREVPKLAVLMDGSESDVLAFMANDRSDLQLVNSGSIWSSLAWVTCRLIHNVMHSSVTGFGCAP